MKERSSARIANEDLPKKNISSATKGRILGRNLSSASNVGGDMVAVMFLPDIYRRIP
jgi:hypothetical protein